MIEVPGKLHRMYYTLLTHPPRNFTFSIERSALVGSKSTSATLENLFIHSSALIPLKLLKSMLGVIEPLPRQFDLVYSGGILEFRNVNWVVDVEDALNSFRGLQVDRRAFKSLVERTLGRENCRAVICHFHATAKSLEDVYDAASFRRKIVQVPYTVQLAAYRPKRTSRVVRFLFLGSANFSTPNWFYGKGGHLALKAFVRLRKKHENIYLTIASAMPSEYKNVLHDDHIQLIAEPVYGNVFDDLLWNSDVCLLPAWITPGLSFLDAMNHNLPIITVDTYANSEVVQDGVNGFVCDTPEELAPIRGTWNIKPGDRKVILRTWYRENESIVDALAEQMERLIASAELREEFGIAGRREIESGGRFSLSTRNQALSNVLNHVLGR